MAIIRPFRAFRPPPQMADQVAELPYDVVSASEARAIASQRPHSFFHVSRAEIDFGENQNPHDSIVYEKAKKNLEKLVYDKALLQDSRESFYVYQLKFQGRTQTGIVALCSTDEYEKGIIKRHELTRQDKEDDRVKHIEFCSAHTGLVFLTYRRNEVLKNAVYKEIENKSPDTNITTSDSVEHKIWSISDPKTIYGLAHIMQKVSSLYIADGHHRAHAAWRVGRSRSSSDSKFFMAGIFSEDELKILPYYRILKNIPKNIESVLQLSNYFSLKTLEGVDSFEPRRPHEFGIYFNEKWYELTLRPETVDKSDLIKSLDVYILQENLLKPVFGIKDPRTDENIDFMGGVRGVNALREHCREKNFLGITLFATSLEEVMNVADKSLIMPPKSTWFEPKLRSGLFVNRFD
ncbi:MAG: hypothetical protein A4S09_11120 [Proteobacteria bacterium SG_bin7]|nr:MAG: hypothetical protein A4S09_11120 [Proteobacteria bacterium SG_bin7]